MIGDFRHSEQADGKAIYVSMHWGPRRQRLAHIVPPSRVRARLEALDYPSLSEEMGIEAALSYALFVGMRIGLPICLTGDPSVWNPAWGRLKTMRHDVRPDTGQPAALN